MHTPLAMLLCLMPSDPPEKPKPDDEARAREKSNEREKNDELQPSREKVPEGQGNRPPSMSCQCAPPSSERKTCELPKLATVANRTSAFVGLDSKRVMVTPGNSGPAMLGLQVFPPSRLRKNPPFSVPI